MVDYVKMAAMALQLVTKNGKEITIAKLNTAPSDTAKPWRGPADQRSPYADTQSVMAVAVPLSGLGKMIDKKDIPDGVKDFYLVTPGLSTPALNDYDELVDGDTTSRIVSISVLKPADVVMLYAIGVQK